MLWRHMQQIQLTNAYTEHDCVTWGQCNDEGEGEVSGYGRPRQMDVEGGPGVTMSQSSLFLQFWCHFYDLSVRRANFEKGEPLYLILTRNITSYHFKQKITKNQSFCGSCSFEFDVFHSIARKLSHLLNEIFPKLNSMIELIESLYLSLFQPLLSNLKLSFLIFKIIGAIFFRLERRQN